MHLFVHGVAVRGWMTLHGVPAAATAFLSLCWNQAGMTQHRMLPHAGLLPVARCCESR